MYGMIHTAAREMVIQTMGDETWESIKNQNGLVEADFISGSQYTDEKTLNIINTISEVCDIEMTELLHGFGKFWITHTSESSYSSIYKMFGNDLFLFLENLNRMHETIETTLPEVSTPTFECINKTNDKMELLYISKREGLEIFVLGLLEGLMDYFNKNGNIIHKDTNEVGAVFEITLTG